MRGGRNSMFSRFVLTKMKNRNSKCTSTANHHYCKENVYNGIGHKFSNSSFNFKNTFIKNKNSIISAIQEIDSRKTSICSKCPPIKPVRVAKIAESIVTNNFATPISSLIFSLVIKAKHLLCFVIFLSSIFVKWGLRILKYTWFVSLLNQSFANHQTHCDLDFGYHFYCNDGAEEEIAVQPKKRKDHKAELEQMKQEL